MQNVIHSLFTNIENKFAATKCAHLLYIYSSNRFHMCVCVFVNFSILSIRMVWCAIFAGIFLYVATNISKSIWTKQQINSDDLWRPNSFPIILSRKEKKKPTHIDRKCATNVHYDSWSVKQQFIHNSIDSPFILNMVEPISTPPIVPHHSSTEWNAYFVWAMLANDAGHYIHLNFVRIFFPLSLPFIHVIDLLQMWFRPKFIQA